MTLFSRTPREVTPLSEGVESLLRGLPRSVAHDPARAKMSLLAAFERARPVEVSPIFRALRVAVPAGALAAGAVLSLGVFGDGVFGNQRPPDIGMVRRGDVTSTASLAEVRLRVVDSPQMPVFVSALGDGPDAP
jgi:hypothetical protein